MLVELFFFYAFFSQNSAGTKLDPQAGVYRMPESECNWQYYVNHGYEKIGEGDAPEFSTDKEDYTYYMFRKRIL